MRYLVLLAASAGLASSPANATDFLGDTDFLDFEFDLFVPSTMYVSDFCEDESCFNSYTVETDFEIMSGGEIPNVNGVYQLGDALGPWGDLTYEIVVQGTSLFGQNLSFFLDEGGAPSCSGDGMCSWITYEGALDWFPVQLVGGELPDPGSPDIMPEPSVWALMLAGFAAMGAMLRGKRRRPALNVG